MQSASAKFEDVSAYLAQLWANPIARQQRHLQLREVHTVYLTDNAPDTFSWTTSQISRWLVSNPDFGDKSRLLDVGCGGGHYLTVLVPRFAHYGVGLDKRATAATENPHIGWVQGDVLNLPFGAKTFGAAMANRMLNQTENIAPALSEIRRVLQPNGLLFVVTADRETVPLLQAIHEAALQQLAFPPRLYTHATLPNQRLNYENGSDWLQTAGFHQVQLEDYKRLLRFEELDVAMEHYATGLIFQKSEGFDNTEIRPALWATLYLTVKARLAEILGQFGHIEISEGATLFIAKKEF